MKSKMIDLKMTEKQAKKNYGLASPSKADMPKYPYGTSLSFNKEQIEKIDALQGAKVGDMLHVNGMGKVVSVSQRDHGRGSGHRDVEIQIQKIEIMPQKSAAKKMRDEVGKEVFEE